MEKLIRIFNRLDNGYDSATLTRVQQEISGAYIPADVQDFRNTVSELLELKAMIDTTITEMENMVEASVRSGTPVFGYDLQKGRTSRSIINEDRVATLLTDMGISSGEIYETKMRGIPHLESLLKSRGREGLLTPHIKCKVGEPKLVRK